MQCRRLENLQYSIGTLGWIKRQEVAKLGARVRARVRAGAAQG